MSHSLDFAFRLVHIHNIPHILKDGFVCAYSSKASKDYISIGDGEVIAKRCATQVNDGILLSRYVPFYLGPRSPMLYVIQNGFNGVKRFSPSELVYCIVRLSDIQQEPNIDCVLQMVMLSVQLHDIIRRNIYIRFTSLSREKMFMPDIGFRKTIWT